MIQINLQSSSSITTTLAPKESRTPIWEQTNAQKFNHQVEATTQSLIT